MKEKGNPGSSLGHQPGTFYIGRSGGNGGYQLGWKLLGLVLKMVALAPALVDQTMYSESLKHEENIK